MLMICSAVCALMTLAFLLDAAFSAVTANSAGSGRRPPSLATVTLGGTGWVARSCRTPCRARAEARPESARQSSPTG